MRTPVETFRPAKTYDQALNLASELWGIQADYSDIWGKRHVTPPDLQRAILKSFGVPAETLDDVNSAIEDHYWQEWSALVCSTVVISRSKPGVAINLPDEMTQASLEGEIRLEDGSTQPVRVRASELPETRRMSLRGCTFVRRELALSPETPLGYHTLHLQAAVPDRAPLTAQARVILCPETAWTPSLLEGDGKTAGIAVSLYGLRSHRNWGCGDITDLNHFVDWTAEHLNASFVALNPLHAIANREPYNTSPYLPTSSYYRNPIYLDVQALEDVKRSPVAQRLLGSPKLQAEIQTLRASTYVEYEKVWRLKLCFLKVAFREFLKDYRAQTARALEFNRYIDAEGELLDRYAVYCALDETLHKRDPNVWIWPQWPEGYRTPGSQDVRDFTRQHWRLVLLYKYMQWQLDLQLAAAQQHATRKLAIGLYHDLALATDRCGSDLWAHGDHYIAGCRVGAPPDSFSPKGQDWAFPPPDSQRHRAGAYALFTQSIRNNLRHGGALRIDHVMRFFRLYWIPDGKDATSGAYVRDYSDDLLRILSLESVRNRVIVIGEDLGTVEPKVRESLQRYGIRSYRLLYFEKTRSEDFKLPDTYPRQALVSITTHDLPTLAGFWEGRDIEARRRAGLFPDDRSYSEQVRSRAEEKQKLIDAFVGLRLLPPGFPTRAADIPEFVGELHNAAVGFLSTTPSELFVLNQEDLFKDTEQQNLPGTTDQYPNWRHKMRYSIEDLSADPVALGCAGMFRDWLGRTGRANA